MAEGATSGRPLSPHLQVWRFTVTMAASITHRGTGFGIYSVSLLLAVWLYALAFSPALYEVIVGFVNSPIGFIIIAGYVWALSFHLMNGMRHLYWDSGRGLAPKTATMTAWTIYIASVLVTIFIMWSGFAARGGA